MRKANSDSTHYHYSPFLIDEDNDDAKTALIVLNSPIHNPPTPLFDKLWQMANFRVCADGGANRLFDATNGNDFIPNLIRGDLDSLRSDVRDHYAEKGSRIEKDPSQDTNDLDKCLQILHKEWLNQNCCNYRICIYGAFGGRFDQEMASIQALYNWRQVFQNRLFLYDDRTSAFLLSEGVINEIRLPFYGERSATETDIGDGPTCGLIPIGSRCESVKTTGLKWNLNGDVPLEFGGLVSTSNRVMEAVVTVQTSRPIVFTAEVMPGAKV
jgi:thiamine pyrophosphokinase